MTRTYEFASLNFSGEECPRCGVVDWLGIPDSLAQGCRKCGFVRVLGGADGQKYSGGATIQEWARDLAEPLEPEGT